MAHIIGIDLGKFKSVAGSYAPNTHAAAHVARNPPEDPCPSARSFVINGGWRVAGVRGLGQQDDEWRVGGSPPDRSLADETTTNPPQANSST